MLKVGFFLTKKDLTTLKIGLQAVFFILKKHLKFDIQSNIHIKYLNYKYLNIKKITNVFIQKINVYIF